MNITNQHFQRVKGFGKKGKVFLLLIIALVIIIFVSIEIRMSDRVVSILPTKKLVIPKNVSNVSWQEVKILAQQCEVAELIDGHTGDGVVLKDGRSFVLVGSLGYGGMMELTRTVKSKCGFISVGAE